VTRASVRTSIDGSTKYALRLGDGQDVETVLMPGESHTTLCVSTQVGCAMGCDFCMTARMGLLRNLTPGEIVQQVVEASRDLPPDGFIRNIVFMGMGEPLHNIDNLARAIEILSEDFGFGFSARRLTVSTSGLVPGIRRFIREGIRANLAVSLNAVNDEVRDRIMPVNRRWNLSALLAACKELPKESRIRLTFEYVMLAGVNDSLADARALVRLLHGLKCKVNLIPYNPPPGLPYQRPELGRVREFQEVLLGKGMLATVRISRGQDIQAACGQLIAGDREPGGRFAHPRPASPPAQNGAVIGR
jgi:23S rRNA (adenine2503-C2)-methyltransferase